MRRIWTNTIAWIFVFAFLGVKGLAQLPHFKPGFNLFSQEQDIQLGQEAAAEVQKQMEVINNPELNAYISSIGTKLTGQPQAGKYAYSFKVVNEPTIKRIRLAGRSGICAHRIDRRRG